MATDNSRSDAPHPGILRLAFMGTPDFAVRALAAIVEAGHHVACVYTQPPAPRGRGQVLTPSAVGAYATGLGLVVRTPKSMRDEDEVAAFRALDLDVAVVAAYGQILVGEVLDAPRLGCFNLHASLLPRWRGAAPIQRAIMAGDAVTGVQVMRMSVGLDEGPILLSQSVPIAADDTAGTLHDKLARAAAGLIPEALAAIAGGAEVETPQAADGVTYAKKIRPKAARIDWRRPAVEVDRRIRGLSPQPGAWLEAATPRGPVRVKVLLSRVEPAPSDESDMTIEAGRVLDDSLLVACGEGAVRLLRLQREGRAPQDAETLLRGLAIPAGTRLA